MQYRVIITGAHGLVGDGVLQECLESKAISAVLLVSRWSKQIKHPKLKELIIPDFLELDAYERQLKGYDACFYCTECPAASLDERICSHFAIDMTLSLACRLLELNPNIVFSFLSSSTSDTTELGTVMKARIMGKAENALAKLIFKKLYFFRVGLVASLSQQKCGQFHEKIIYRLFPLLKIFIPNRINTTKEIGLAMINALINKYPERIVDVKAIKSLSTYHQGASNICNPLVYIG
ncbi:MAG: hypothetical protein REI64_14570 [Pedobacter sp.]|uniref:hypothetical protein n=1 Tax=Pedobacter sp. TaxID=1411316 RepID=UPI0028072A0A|nr:hypothetical protein [Pedobacter sp.]MDQ8006023.1 hypothetical protein [Pedobacter sp.]